MQALQLALLRRFTLQMQGASRNAALPGVLMRDAAAEGVGKGDSPIEGSAVDASHKCVRMLQELQAMAASDWPLQLSTGALFTCVYAASTADNTKQHVCCCCLRPL